MLCRIKAAAVVGYGQVQPAACRLQAQAYEAGGSMLDHIVQRLDDDVIQVRLVPRRQSRQLVYGHVELQPGAPLPYAIAITAGAMWWATKALPFV